MPAHRLPVAKAAATGADIKNPGRHRDRKSPRSRDLGDPSPFLRNIPSGEQAWEAFKRELPWLTEGHRAFVEVIVPYRASLLGGKLLNTSEVKNYQAMLSKLGATPVDETKVSTPNVRPRAASGTIMTEVSRSSFNNRRCSSSLTPPASISSVMCG